MRWVVLPLSFGTAVMSVIYGIFMKWVGTGSDFTWLTFALLIVSAILAMVGGLVAFNGRRAGGIFLIAAAVACFFAYTTNHLFDGLYLVGGLLSFAIRRSSNDRGYDEDGDGDEENDEDDESGAFSDGQPQRKSERFKGISYGKRRERAAALLRTGQQDKAEYRVEDDSLERLNKMVKERHSMVCLTCGNTVGINHNFCYHCGASLLNTNHNTGQNQAEPDDSAYEEADEPRYETPAAEHTKYAISTESRAAYGNFSEPEPDEAYEADEEAEDDREDSWREDEDVREDEPKTPFTHKVFVKPQEEQRVFKRSVIIDPDDSYQEFSAYTRRRKRRRHSLPRRILGICVLLAVVGGAAWLLTGLREASWPDENAESATEGTLPIDPIADNPIAQPVVETPELPAVRVDSPTRGVVTGNSVNLRPDHSTSGAPVTRLGADTRAEVFERWEGQSGTLSGPWFRIRVNNREGWIYGEYFQALDGRAATLPPGYTAWLLKTFGADKTELLSGQLGQPARQTATAITWDGLTAGVRDDAAITRLQLTSAKHVLQNGIAVGMDESALYRNIGYPSEYRSGQLRYVESGNQGIAVRMQNGKVQNITVGNI